MSQPSIHIAASLDSWIEQAAVDQPHQTALLEGIDRIVGLPDLHAGRGVAVGAGPAGGTGSSSGTIASVASPRGR